MHAVVWPNPLEFSSQPINSNAKDMTLFDYQQNMYEIVCSTSISLMMTFSKLSYRLLAYVCVLALIVSTAWLIKFDKTRIELQRAQTIKNNCHWQNEKLHHKAGYWILSEQSKLDNMYVISPIRRIGVLLTQISVLRIHFVVESFVLSIEMERREEMWRREKRREGGKTSQKSASIESMSIKHALFICHIFP